MLKIAQSLFGLSVVVTKSTKTWSRKRELPLITYSHFAAS